MSSCGEQRERNGERAEHASLAMQMLPGQCKKLRGHRHLSRACPKDDRRENSLRLRRAAPARSFCNNSTVGRSEVEVTKTPRVGRLAGIRCEDSTGIEEIMTDHPENPQKPAVESSKAEIQEAKSKLKLAKLAVKSAKEAAKQAKKELKTLKTTAKKAGRKGKK